MVPSTTLVVLAYISPVLSIVGFIIMPGLTHIRPWLLDKFNDVKKDMTKTLLSKDYKGMDPVDLFKEKITLEDNYKFDLRSKIRKRKKEINKAISEIKCINCDKRG